MKFLKFPLTFLVHFSGDNCKLKLSDHAIVITNYKDGFQTGFIREWNTGKHDDRIGVHLKALIIKYLLFTAGQLVHVGYSYRDQKIGQCW